jgi:hypothetical protein
MEVINDFDFDDLTTAKFQNQDIYDPELKATNNHLLMKYFGNKLKHSPSHIVHKRETFTEKRWLSYMKPVLLSIFIVILAMLTRSTRVTEFLSFTSKELVNRTILYGGFFLVILIILVVAN